MTSPSALTPNTLVHERYLIVRPIGQGGMGAVYEAIDQRLGNTVALKQTLLSGVQLDRAFEREARLLAGLRHAALPVVSDYFADGADRFLVMQYIPGDDFAALLTQRGAPFPTADVLGWGNQLLDALDYLHTQQPPIIHRDIKPQNMKLTPRGELILLDFGLAKGDTAQPGANSTASLISYTPQYSPLEQIQGAGAGPRGDLYALAATLYHLLTNVPPANALERAGASLQNRPDPLQPPHMINPEVPPAVSAVLLRALAFNPDERPASAAVMREALHQAAVPQPDLVRTANIGPTLVATPAPPPVAPTPVQPETPQRSNTALAGIGCVVALAVALILAVVVGISQLGNLRGLIAGAPTPVRSGPTPISSPTPDGPIIIVENPPPARTPRPTSTPEQDRIATPEPQPTAAAAPGFASVVLKFGQEGTGQGFFQDARGIALDGQGNIYVSEYVTGRVQKFDSQGAFILSWMTDGDTPLQDLASDRAGNVYVVRGGKILKYNGANGELLDTFADAESNFNHITLLPNNGLLASSWQNRDDLVHLDAEGAIVSRLENAIAQQSDQPELNASVAADGLGNMFVLGAFNNAVFRFSPEAKFVNKFGAEGDAPGQFRAPSAIAVDNQSRVYVSDFKGIQVFDADGRYLDRIPVTVVRSMVFDNKNNLFVVTSHQQVIKYTISKPS